MNGLSRSSTIFACFLDDDLQTRLEALAAELGCTVFWPTALPDMIAVPWFAAIVDRKILGQRAWALYEEYWAETQEPEACLLVDNGPPSPFAMYQVPLLTPETEEAILAFIAAVHALVTKETNAAKAINTALHALYTESLQGLRDALAGIEGVGGPLLIKVTESYLRARTRLMVVGQQTRGWPSLAEGVERLMTAYEEFELGRRYRPTPFWQASHELHRRLNPRWLPCSFLWSNLVKVDVNGERPPMEVEDLVCGVPLLREEIRLTGPEVVVFFTGPDYDERLEDTFPALSFEEVTPIVRRLRHSDLPAHAYRTAHPGYLWRVGRRGLIAELAATIMAG